MFRKPLIALFAIVSIGAFSQPAHAEDKDLGNLSTTKVEGLCGDKDGTYFVSPDSNNYGCGYKGGGGILCDKETGCLETTRTGGTRGPDDRWGLLGLLGLAGLLTLGNRRRRDADVDIDRRRDPTT